MTESHLRIGVIDPEVLGTYGDTGNALVLAHRARSRGVDADIVMVHLDETIPADLDLYVMGGGEDTAQALAAEHLRTSRAFSAALARGHAPLLAICASFQILGHSYTDAHGRTVAGAGLLDCHTCPQGFRSIGELVSTPLLDGLTQALTGFENHGGATQLGPDATPLGRVTAGAGNATDASERVDGACQGSIVATYMHGPALARNPELADLLLARALGVSPGSLAPLEVPFVADLRAERLAHSQVNTP